MSGGYTSLESSIRTCKVNTGNADRIESDRFLGFPDKKMCPPFLGTDLTGRAICPDSFMTKSAGCNTPEDRIYIENTVCFLIGWDMKDNFKFKNYISR